MITSQSCCVRSTDAFLLGKQGKFELWSCSAQLSCYMMLADAAITSASGDTFRLVAKLLRKMS